MDQENFCRWVADVPPRETSTAAKSEEKRMFSQASKKVTGDRVTREQSNKVTE